MRLRSLVAASGGLLVLSTLPAPAQTPDAISSGFSLLPNPHAVGVFDAYATLPGGERIVFDGSSVRRESEDGSVVAPLGSVPAPVFASLVRVAPDAKHALIGESSNGSMYVVDIVHGGLTPAGTLNFNYDAVFEDATHAIVSASSCVFCGFSELYRIDIASGVTTLLASVTGPSGPLVRASNGDVYYGRQSNVFPPPAGSIDVVRYTAAQLASGLLLTDADAALFSTGLDGASAMALDPVYGHLLVSESTFSGGSRIAAFDRLGQRFGDVIESTGTVSNLELFAVAGIGSFQAYQPAGVQLSYRTTDYVGSTSTIWRVAPARPVAKLSGAGTTGPGTVTFTLTGAVPGGSFLVLLGPRAQFDPNEFTSDTGTFLFHTGMNLIRRTGLIVPTDATGTGSFSFTNPGTLQGTRVLQAVIRDTSNHYVGTSSAALL